MTFCESNIWIFKNLRKMGNNNKKKIRGDMKGKAAGSAISVNRRKKQGQ